MRRRPRNNINTQPRRSRRPTSQWRPRRSVQQPAANRAGPGVTYEPPQPSRTLVDLTGPWTITPPEIRTVLPYHEEVTATSGTYFTDRVYSLNSLYDPDVTSTGHQPMGFDQWAVFYNHYRVIQTSYQFRVNNASTTSGLSVYLVVSDDPTPITSTPVAGELPFTEELIVGSSTGNDVKTRTAVYNLPQLWGRSLSQYRSEKDYSGTFLASPTEQFYLHVFLRSSDGAATIDANYSLKLNYLTEIFERKKMPLS